MNKKTAVKSFVDTLGQLPPEYAPKDSSKYGTLFVADELWGESLYETAKEEEGVKYVVDKEGNKIGLVIFVSGDEYNYVLGLDGTLPLEDAFEKLYDLLGIKLHDEE